MTPKGILETALYVDNLNLAEIFYTNIIGLQLHSKKENRHLFFRCGEGMLLLFNPNITEIKIGKVPVHGSKGQGHVAFNVEDDSIDEWRNHLINNKIEIESEIDWPSGGYSIYFRDPSRNSLELTTPQIWKIDTN